MKIIIEAINFAPGIDLQNFIMKKAEGLKTPGQNIAFIKINLCISDEGIYCNIILDTDKGKIDILLMDSSLHNVVLNAIRYARKYLNQTSMQSIGLKNDTGHLQNFNGMLRFDFSKN